MHSTPINLSYRNFGAIPANLYSAKINNGLKCDYAAIDKALLTKIKYYVDSARQIARFSNSRHGNYKTFTIHAGLNEAPSMEQWDAIRPVEGLYSLQKI